MPREKAYARLQQYRPTKVNGERALVPTYTARKEQARLVLGAQDPPPRTTPLRHMNAKVIDQGLEMVVGHAYYHESEKSLIDLSPKTRPEQPSVPSFYDSSINQLMYVANQRNKNYNQLMLQQ